MTRRAAVEAPIDHGWTDHAACRTATPVEADALTEVTRLAEAAPLVARWCAGCPVKALCEAQGRALRADGVWGGEVLRLGRTSRDRRPRAASPRPVPQQRAPRPPRVRKPRPVPVQVLEPTPLKRRVPGQPLRAPRTTPAEREAIRLHLSRGLSATATARTVGVNRSTVTLLIERERLRVNAKDAAEEE
ncbi:WhiB family transcriptional regulator [Quadrisphaera setariae]|uniref:WhiB family transcriptional regulator n=1 Tax=Quadrisphaera setariae TaxID=2593304 RepID=UPI001650CE6A|nr:WhiB family transcriptional regulator [Quadrisphaera setariae]